MVTSSDKYAELTALFRAGLAGDDAAYNRFLQTVSAILRRVIGKRLPAADVEDVLQEVLISVHKARHTYDGVRPLMPWLLAIVQFRTKDHLRKIYAAAETEIIDPERLPDVTEQPADAESIDELLDQVPAREKHLLKLMYVEGYTAREAGKQLDMKESAVKVAAHRAIRKIRERWKSSHENE